MARIRVIATFPRIPAGYLVEFKEAAANLGALFGKLLELGGGCKFAVFGNPTSELREATSGFDWSVFPTHLQGK
jgi:hypothetical protein